MGVIYLRNVGYISHNHTAQQLKNWLNINLYYAPIKLK
jgi:hypothetical protein